MKTAVSGEISPRQSHVRRQSLVQPGPYLEFGGFELEDYPPRPEHIATDQSSQPEKDSVGMGKTSASQIKATPKTGWI